MAGQRKGLTIYMNAKRKNTLLRVPLWGWVVQRRLPSTPSRKTRWRDWDGLFDHRTSADQVLTIRQNASTRGAMFRVVRRKYSEGVHP